jgi:hypothetical protein
VLAVLAGCAAYFFGLDGLKVAILERRLGSSRA